MSSSAKVQAHMEGISHEVAHSLFLNSALHYAAAFAGEEQLSEWLYNVKQC